MKGISVHVGERIRLYRKIKNLTIEAFAKLINKSKATVSKYENGDISIDIETLFIIANALGISVNQLIDFDQNDMEAKNEQFPADSPSGKKRMYMYFYDGRKSRIVRNVIEIGGALENGVCRANLYSDLEDYSNFYQCKYLYHGTMRKYDTFTNFNFENQNNKVERVFLYAINSFSHSGRVKGLFSGLSTHSAQPILPVSFKFVISPDIMEENGELRELLLITKEDIKQIKKLNMFMVGQ